jgi:hypothetical protein
MNDLEKISKVVEELTVYGESISGNKIRKLTDYKKRKYYTYSFKSKLAKVMLRLYLERFFCHIRLDNRTVFWHSLNSNNIDIKDLQDKIDDSLKDLVKASEGRVNSLKSYDKKTETLLKLKEALINGKISLDFKPKGYQWKDITYNVCLSSRFLTIPLVYRTPSKSRTLTKKSIAFYTIEAEEKILSDKNKIIKKIDEVLIKIKNKKEVLEDINECQKDSFEKMKILL